MKKCTQTDKRILALVISMAMLASTFTYGTVFAVEEQDTGDAAAKATETLDTKPAQEQNGEAQAVPGTEAEPEATTEPAAEPATGPAAEPEAEPEPAVKAAEVEPADQSITVLVVNGAKKILVKPGANWNYSLPLTVKKVRDNTVFTLYVRNPEGCAVSMEAEAVESNISSDVPFIQIEDIDTEGLSAASVGFDTELAEGEQLTAYQVTVNGTGQADMQFKAAGTEITEPAEGAETEEGTVAYNPVQGKITVTQTRPTTDMNKGASVTSKSVTPGAIKVAYQEKYTKTIYVKKKGKKKKKKKKVTAYRTAYRNFEIVADSGLSETGFGAVQGAGTDGTYSYSTITQKGNDNYVKIVKTRLSDMKVVKTSGLLNLNHANDVTYDSANGRLVVTHNKINRKRVSFVNPSTLTVTGYKDIQIPNTLKGATKEQLSAIKGFASVTYMREGKYAGHYIAIISSYHNFLVLDQNFKPVEYISVAAKYNSEQVYYQGVDAIGDKLYVGVYPRNYSQKNMISVYDMDGEYKGTIYLIKGFEMENVYHAGGTQYVTLYKPVTKVWYTTKTVKKKVKVKKKGKIKYKKKKVKVQVKHTKTVKRSYIYKMGTVSF